MHHASCKSSISRVCVAALTVAATQNTNQEFSTDERKRVKAKEEKEKWRRRKRINWFSDVFLLHKTQLAWSAMIAGINLKQS